MNMHCRTHGTGREFFAAYSDAEPGCLVLEATIPDISGCEIQRRLAANHALVPLIFLSSSANVSLVVELLRGGAVHFLRKPMRPLELIKALREALEIDRARRETSRRRRAIARAGDLLRLIADGKSSQEIAAELHLGLCTVEFRRASLMTRLRRKPEDLDCLRLHE
jgi:FixJ family two-component response regulator